MNQPQPIETARSPGLRGSWLALQRAAVRARQIAVQTGTAVVVVRDGVVQHLYPASAASAQSPAPDAAVPGCREP